MSNVYLTDEELLQAKQKRFVLMKYKIVRENPSNKQWQNFIKGEINRAREDLDKFEKEHPELVI